MDKVLMSQPRRHSGSLAQESDAPEALLAQRVLQHVADVVVVLAADGAVRYCSPSVQALLGYAPDDLIGGEGLALVAPDDAARVRRAFERALCDPQASGGLRFLLRCADGALRSVEARCVNRLDDEVLAGLLVTLRDVGQRPWPEQASALPRAQLLLAQREAQIQAMLNNTAQSFVLLDENARVLTFNEVADERTQTVYGRPLAVGELLYSYVKPEYRGELRDLFERALRGESIRQEMNIGRPGEPRWFAFEYRPVTTAEGTVIGVCLAVLDTTIYHNALDALAQSEERWRALIQHSSDTLLVLDANSVVRFASPALEQVLGYPLDEFVGGHIGDLIHPDDREQASQARKRLVATSGARVVLSARVRHRDGHWVWLEGGGVNMLDNPSVGGLIIALRDISERRSLEAQLQHAQRMESIGRLAGGMAHDFNNLLTAILGNAELMLTELSPDDPLREDVTLIHNTATRAAALTRQLLAFARKQVLMPQALDLNSCVGGMEQLLHRLIGSDVLLATQLTPDLPLVYADRSQIEQVLVNLAVNARDAMPAGGRLTITTAVVLRAPEGSGGPPERHVRLTVSDTGLGMSSEVLQHLFEPFFTTKAQGQGTGLGLATCYGIVHQHGGTITVSSTEGQGTTVVVDLPAMSVPAQRSPEQDDQAGAPRGSETVLLVDDAPTVRMLVSRMLQAQGYHVQAATDGAHALALAAGMARPPDLVIADVVMPHMSGHVLAELLRQRYPQLRVLLMSGNADLGRAPNDCPPSDFPILPKPFGPALLAQKVREILDSRG
ncbi:MAG TPA: PAS domain S-box protein [Roseiflexaceae bacterium]|nr:PAS domain S-box protein [Roseiflexaceae bacterium]